ncbi:MAG: hypothetical protein PWP23_1525 [Candidatus Sumerlaeota bacterium]|nr:hypothetical protein [Candidatus Sumerlaeota bacterium]
MRPQPGISLILLTALMLLVRSLPGVTPESDCDEFPACWASFSPEPLTVILPEAVSVSNPPFLHWQHLPGATLYSITVLGEEFEWTHRTTWNFAMPAEGLAPGQYSLTIEALDSEGDVLSSPATSAFSIDREPDGLNVDLNALALRPGAAVGWSPQQIEAIAGAQGAMLPTREQLLEAARKQAFQGAQSPTEPERYPDGVWDYSVWSKNNTLASSVQDRIAEQILAWEITGEEAFASEAQRLALILADWAPTGATGVWENDHSAHAVLRSLSLAYGHLADRMTEEERAKVRLAIAARCEDMYAFLNPFVSKTSSAGAMNDPDNNHPWFCNTALGLGALALGPDDPRAEEWACFATQMYRGVFLPRGDSQGGWHEGNDYWSYMLYFVFQFTDALNVATGIDLLEHPWLRATGRFKVMAHPPVGAHVPFSNSKQHPPNGFDKVVMMRLASRFDDPVLWQYVNAIDVKLTYTRDLQYSLLWGDDDPPPPETETGLPFAVFHKDMGWVVSNSDPFDVRRQTIFAFRAGPFAGRGFGHLHADQNSFVLTAGSDKLLWDAGYYDGYLTPHNKEYSRQSAAHNTILVDGVGQLVQVAGLNAHITDFQTEGRSLSVTGDASEPLLYDGRVETFVRSIDYDEENRTLRLADTIRLKEPGVISFLLHSAHPIIYDSGVGALKIRGRDHMLEARFISDIPFTAILTDTFPVPPNRPAGKESQYPEQYHLELRTNAPVDEWKPQLEAKWWATGQKN